MRVSGNKTVSAPMSASTHQGGSGTKMALATSVPGGKCWRHCRTRAHMLKAEATGPRVPAIMGKADEVNHQRLTMTALVGTRPLSCEE